MKLDADRERDTLIADAKVYWFIYRQSGTREVVATFLDSTGHRLIALARRIGA